MNVSPTASAVPAQAMMPPRVQRPDHDGDADDGGAPKAPAAAAPRPGSVDIKV